MDLCSPLQQLNLLLSLTLTQKPDDRIIPVLCNMGYAVISVGSGIPVAQHLRASLPGWFQIEREVSPDVVLHSDRGDLLVVECKATTFASGVLESPEGFVHPPTRSREVRQARTLLLLGITGVGSTIGAKPISSGSISYLIGRGDIVLQEECLSELCGEIESIGYKPSTWDVWLLSERSDGLHLLGSTNCRMGPDRHIVRLSEGEPFVPPSYIPLEPDIDLSDPRGNEDLREMVRVAVVELFLSLQTVTSVITLDHLCSNVIYVWKACSPSFKKHLRSLIRGYLEVCLMSMKRLGLTWRYSSDSIVLEIPDEDSLCNLKRYVAGSVFQNLALDKPQAQKEMLVREPPNGPWNDEFLV